MNEKLDINLKSLEVKGEGEITLRVGEALKPLPPKKLEITGNIDSVTRFLKKRGFDNCEQIESHILVDRQNGRITLSVFETDPFENEIVRGEIRLNPEFKKFQINEPGAAKGLIQMADFVKMNRIYFDEPGVAMQLVAELKNFKAKINREIEKSTDGRGNDRNLFEQKVQSNLPKGFTLKMPIFKNEAPRKFMVDINIIVRDSELTCYLESLEANDIIREETQALIDNEIKQIEEIAPGIVIIEE